LESIDRDIVGPLSKALTPLGPHRILISPDHPTPVRTKTHSHGMVPFLIHGTGISTDGATQYGETAAAASPLAFPDGSRLMDYFLHHQTGP